MLEKKSEKKLEWGGGKTLGAGPLKKITFLRLPFVIVLSVKLKNCQNTVHLYCCFHVGPWESRVHVEPAVSAHLRPLRHQDDPSRHAVHHRGALPTVAQGNHIQL